MDMDGVLVREEHAIPGATEFIARLRETNTPFLLLTNNSIYTRRDLAARLRAGGLDVPEEAIWTSALATAGFLEDQRPGGTAFVIGESGLTTALHDAGYTIDERSPDTWCWAKRAPTALSESLMRYAWSAAARASSPPTPTQ